MAKRKEGSRASGEPESKVVYKIKLTLLDRETGESRPCTLEEAKTWDWENPEVWRIVGGWQITSFQKLLNILYLKMEKGCKEVEILEAPRFTMLSGG